MATTNDSAPATAQSPSRPRTENSRGGGRGRGRGRAHYDSADGEGRQQHQQDGRGGRRGRGGPRGGGAPRSHGGGVPLSAADLSQRFSQPSQPASAPTIPIVKVAEESKEEDEDVEAEVCFICASPVVHNSVAPCNHRTCHICAIRMRALYKTKDCAHCRVCIIRLSVKLLANSPLDSSSLRDLYR